MRVLTYKERAFFEGLLRYSCKLHNGYYVYRPRNKKYGKTRFKRSRITFQLVHNVFLETYEVIHHIDRDRTNDNIANLELMSSENHNSLHFAGQKMPRIKKIIPHNKLSEDKIKEIILEYKNDVYKGKINYSKIGKKLCLSGVVVKKYINEYLKNLC